MVFFTLHGRSGGLLDLAENVLDLAAVGIKAQRRQALAPEMLQPARGLRVVGQIGLVQNQNARLALGHPRQIGVAGGQRRARVAQLDHRVHGAQLVL